MPQKPNICAYTTTSLYDCLPPSSSDCLLTDQFVWFDSTDAQAYTNVAMMDKVIQLDVYCDEVKDEVVHDPVLDRYDNWTHLALLLVPADAKPKLVHELSSRRCLSDTPQDYTACTAGCRFHEGNNTEVHFTEVKDTTKFKIAGKWLDFLLDGNRQQLGLVYFYILGLNLANLDLSRFGSDRPEDNAYNRFFRTALLKSAKGYFHRYDGIVFRNVFHDKGSIETHWCFPWHAIRFIQRNDPKCSFARSQVTFLNSDHREADGHPIDSQLIQFVDLILGSACNCLHRRKTSDHKGALAEKFRPLLKRLIESPNNRNSSYGYFGCQSIDFFPAVDLNKSSLDDALISFGGGKRNLFYKKRSLLIEERHQPSLFS